MSIRSPGTGSTESCEQPHGCWESSLGFLQRQCLFITPELSLQLPNSMFLNPNSQCLGNGATSQDLPLVPHSHQYDTLLYPRTPIFIMNHHLSTLLIAPKCHLLFLSCPFFPNLSVKRSLAYGRSTQTLPPSLPISQSMLPSPLPVS